MHFQSIILTIAGLAALSHAAVPVSHAVQEKRHVVPNKWAKRGRIEGEELLPMRIGLKQNNLHKGYDMLMDM